MFWRSGGKGSLTQSVNYEGVCRTAPATPGLLIIHMDQTTAPLQTISIHQVKRSSISCFVCGVIGVGRTNDGFALSGPDCSHYTDKWNLPERYCIALHCTVLRCTALHCTELHCTALHCTALHCTGLHCTALHCTTLYFTALHHAALHSSVAGSSTWTLDTV